MNAPLIRVPVREMDPKAFEGSTTGKVISSAEGYWAFVPDPLPATIPYDPETVGLLSDADRRLGELSGIGRLLPDPHLLMAPYIRREAVLSSRIEGTRASLSDLLYFEAAEETRGAPDVLEVRNCVRATEYGLERLKKLPLSLRFVREIHARLMQGVRGGQRRPGEFRRSQNWIGPAGCRVEAAVFVPPPVPEMTEALNAWEKFLHEARGLPPLLQCALMHYQFEAIHPFLDGNGRVGRLLITLFLCERGHLSRPLLYLSAFFERHRDEYYTRLLEGSRSGDLVGWIRFFLRGVATQAAEAIADSQRILALQQRYRGLLRRRKATATVLAALDELLLNPYVTTPRLAARLGVSFPTAQAAINWMIRAGVLREVTGRRRNRVYCAEGLLRAIGRGGS